MISKYNYLEQALMHFSLHFVLQAGSVFRNAMVEIYTAPVVRDK